MVPPIYNVLITLQCALVNCVPPTLRAITVDIDETKHNLIPIFYFDEEITGELLDMVTTLLTEVDTYTIQHYFISLDVVELGFKKTIPIRGRLAFLRYEPILPLITRENRSFLLQDSFPAHAIYRLDMQEALLGKVTPALRNVSVAADPEQKKLIAHFIYDGEISELDRKLATAAIEDSRISFPDYEMDSLIERVDCPNQMSRRGNWLAYLRQEWVYKDNAIVYLDRPKKSPYFPS